MKLKLNVFSLFLVSLLLFLPVVPAQAAQPTSGACGANLQWNLDKASGVLTITGTGPMTDYLYNATWYNYYNRDYVKTIVVEDGCTYIGETAFSQLANLTSVTLPASVAGLGRECFVNNRSLREVVMPGVISVGDLCFQNCPALTEAVFPDGLSSVGERCFASCTALTRVVFPGSLDTVGSQIFFACNALQEVVLGDGFTGENCADRAFMGRQSGIARFRIPDSFSRSDALLFDIHFSHFYARTGSVGALALGKMGLSFTDPDDAHLVRKRYLFDESGNHSGLQLEEILDAAWTDIEIPSGYTVIGCNFGKNVTRVVLPDTVTALTGFNGCFSGCTALETVVLPDGLAVLPYNTFFQCAALTSIDLPDSLTAIGPSAFERCTALTAVTLPERLEIVGAYAFAGSGLTAVILPDSVTAIGDSAFRGCKSLVSVRLSAALESLGAAAFEDCTALSSPLTVPAGVTVLPEYCFAFCGALTEIRLPDGLTTIGRCVFLACGKLHSLYLPSGVTSMASMSSYGGVTFFFSKDAAYLIGQCEENGLRYFLTDAAKGFMTLPANLTAIEAGAFEGTAAQEYRIPAGCTAVGSRAFADLPGGTVIVFMGRDAEIAADAFSGSEVFFVCPDGGTVLNFLRQQGYPVYVNN